MFTTVLFVSLKHRIPSDLFVVFETQTESLKNLGVNPFFRPDKKRTNKNVHAHFFVRIKILLVISLLWSLICSTFAVHMHVQMFLTFLLISDIVFSYNLFLQSLILVNRTNTHVMQQDKNEIMRSFKWNLKNQRGHVTENAFIMQPFTGNGDAYVCM